MAWDGTSAVVVVAILAVVAVAIVVAVDRGGDQ